MMDAGQLSDKALRIVCLGDSLTGPGGHCRYLSQYIKWPDLLQLALECLPGIGRVEVLNRGVAGDTSSGALRRLDEDVIAVCPDIAVILIGGNNFGVSGDAGEIQAGLKTDLLEIVTRLQKAKIKTLLLQYPEPKAENMKHVWIHLDRGNPVISGVSLEAATPVAALAPAFRDAAFTHPLDELASAIDGVHLNPYGEVVLARTVVFKLRLLGWI